MLSGWLAKGCVESCLDRQEVPTSDAGSDSNFGSSLLESGVPLSKMPLCGGGGICVVFNVSTAMEYNMCFQTPSVFSQLLSLVQGRLFGCFIQQFYYQCYFLDSRTTKEVPHNNWPVSIIVSHAMRNSEVIATHPHTPTHTHTCTWTLTHGVLRAAHMGSFCQSLCACGGSIKPQL